MLVQNLFKLLAIIALGSGVKGLLKKNLAETPKQRIYEDGCPTWMYHKGNSTSCTCGRGLSSRVLCNESQPNDTFLYIGYCMNTELNYQTNETRIIAGLCPYNTFKTFYNKSANVIINSLFHVIPGDRHELNAMGCGVLNRTGRLCSRCINGTYPTVLSYERKCVHWSKSTAYSITLIFLTSFLPLTAFYCIVVLFRVSANRASLNSFIFVAQVVSAPQLVQTALQYFNTEMVSQKIQTVAKGVCSVYGIWNLDFFKLFVPDICTPHLTTLQALSLEFAITVYPLVLTAVTYLLIELHDRNCRIIVLMWKPFHILCTRFRHHWSIKTSTIDAFATFLLLSFMKLLISSIYFLRPTRIFNIQGEIIGHYYLYYDAETQLANGSRQIVYIVFSIIALSVLVLLPIFLLLFYQTQWFQFCIGRCCSRISLQLTLKTFMDSFQGCYRDRTDGGLDCRFISGLYLLLRALLCLLYEINGAGLTIIILLLISSLFIALLRPYKKQYSIYNIADPILVLVLALQFLCYKVFADDIVINQRYVKGYQVAAAFFVLVPLLYLLCHIIIQLFKRACLHKLCKQKNDAVVMDECLDDNSNIFRYNDNSSRYDYGSMNT